VGSLECILRGLEVKRQESFLVQDRVAMERQLGEYCKELSGHAKVLAFLGSLGGGRAPFVTYAARLEQPLAERFVALRNRMAAQARDAQRQWLKAREAEKLELLEMGRKWVQAGDAPRARAYLNRLAGQFPDEPEALMAAGRILVEAQLPLDAAAFFDLVRAQHPAMGEAYSLAAQIYVEAMEYAKAEAVYLAALKQFGLHPRTLLNTSKLYLAWNKREKAYQYARRALDADPSLREAKEIADMTFRL